MQRYLESRRSQNKRETCKAKSCPAKTPLARATGSGVEDHNEPIFDTTSKLVDTTMLAEGDQYYLNEFDKLIESQDRESPLYLNPGGTASPSLDFAVDRAASSSIPREFAPDDLTFTPMSSVQTWSSTHGDTMKRFRRLAEPCQKHVAKSNCLSQRVIRICQRLELRWRACHSSFWPVRINLPKSTNRHY